MTEPNHEEIIAAADEALPRVRESLQASGIQVCRNRHGNEWTFRFHSGREIGRYWPVSMRAKIKGAHSSHLGVTITQIVDWVKKRA